MFTLMEMLLAVTNNLGVSCSISDQLRQANQCQNQVGLEPHTVCHASHMNMVEVPDSNAWTSDPQDRKHVSSLAQL